MTDCRTVPCDNSHFVLLPLTPTNSPLMRLLCAEASAVCSAAAARFPSQIADSLFSENIKIRDVPAAQVTRRQTAAVQTEVML